MLFWFGPHAPWASGCGAPLLSAMFSPLHALLLYMLAAASPTSLLGFWGNNAAGVNFTASTANLVHGQGHPLRCPSFMRTPVPFLV